MTSSVLFHTHGLGSYDFSAVTVADLDAIDAVASAREARVCATVYLTEPSFHAFGRLLLGFAERKAAGELSGILGFALEGPTLGPRGGTPAGSIWRPTVPQWRELILWFRLGLKYVVIAPDLLRLGDEIDRGFTFGDLVSEIYLAGGRIALGHFGGISAQMSAECLENILAHIEQHYARSPYLVLTDHLFNDMPTAFVHAFRTPAQRAIREIQLGQHAAGWHATTLSTLLGPVPAALLLAAKAGRLTPALNCDGGHVDLAICRRVIDFLGTDRVIGITDHTEVSNLAGEPLTLDPETGLLYRSDGVVAASSITHERQRHNLRAIGLIEAEVDRIFCTTPRAALEYTPCRR